MNLSKYDINLDNEIEIANFYRSLGITCGEGDILFRIILLVLSRKGEYDITQFSEIRKYTDAIADKGSVGSKMKSFLLERLALKVERGGYVITEKGLLAADYIWKSTEYYTQYKMLMEIIERIPS
jgi:hypothetical protein